jgi:hypothetical protein
MGLKYYLTTGIDYKFFAETSDSCFKHTAKSEQNMSKTTANLLAISQMKC